MSWIFFCCNHKTMQQLIFSMLFLCVILDAIRYSNVASRVYTSAASPTHNYFSYGGSNAEKKFRNSVKSQPAGCFNDIYQTEKKHKQHVSRCSIPCEDIANSVELYPFTWAYCPLEPIHLALESSSEFFKDKVAKFSVPTIGYSIQLRKRSTWINKAHHSQHHSSASNESRKRRGKLTDNKTTVKPQTNIPIVAIEAVPAPGSPGPDYAFPIGKTNVQYIGVITENSCIERTNAVGNWETHRHFITEQHSYFENANLTIGSIPLVCNFSVIVHDAQPPKFIFCPGNREFHLRKGQTRIAFNYDKPIAKDNSKNNPKVYQVRGYKSGEKLGPGKHIFEFVAQDLEGNKASCIFHVRIIRNLEDDAFRAPTTAGRRFDDGMTNLERMNSNSYKKP